MNIQGFDHDRVTHPVGIELCANCDAAIGAGETPFVWCDDVVCAPCWTKLETRQRRNFAARWRGSSRDRLGFAAAAAVASGIGSLYLLVGLVCELPGACTIGGAMFLAGLALVVVARPWAS